MSDAATRPRPRPRPKPTQKATEPTSSAASSSTSVSQSKQVQNDDDDDAMFIRQPRKNESTWEFVEKRNRENSKSNQTILLSDSDQEVGTPRRRATKRKANDLSGWQNKRDLKRFMSQGASDSDSDIQILNDTTPKGKDPKVGHEEKRKRSRSRSKSITPPPQIPQSRFETLRNVVRQTLGTERPKSPTYLEAEDDSIDLTLDPELQRIVQNARAQPRERSQSRFSTPPLTNGQGDKVTVTVKWQPHPLNLHGTEVTWVHSIYRNDNFRQIFEAVAEEACVLSENLVLTHRGDRFFPSVSPAGLHIYDEATIVACDKRAWEYMRANRNTRSPVPPPPVSPGKSPSKSSLSTTVSIPEDGPIELTSSGDEIEITGSVDQDQVDKGDSDHDDRGGGGSQSEENDNIPEDTFTLTIRSGSTNKDVTLVVRPTATCGAIVKGFLKKRGLADQYSAFMNGETQLPAARNSRKKVGDPLQKIPALSIDGERAGNDEEIGQYDLEDGDMVEVVGL
ncbi:hypothetical protein L218DRAFT_965269 [Marasmius fiardii PR-910]|nr:hypothetical protein L218DRAFT_965269 [Marasmius fiardii PR-910]